MSLVTVANLSERLGGKWVLRDVSLEVEAGEIIAVFGRSDSGKSLLARLMAGLDEPTDGSITLGEEGSAGPEYVSLAREAPAFAPELTLFENLNLFAALWGVARRKRAKQITFLLELLDLDDRRASRADTISSGALRRLEIARALVADAPVTLIDSLLDHLDPPIFERLWDHMVSLRRDELKSFVIFTSRGKVAEICGRLAVISQGRTAFTGRPDDFRRFAGEDMVVLGDVTNPVVKSRIREQISVEIRENEGFLSFRVSNGQRMVGDLLAEFGSEVSCVYLKRATLEDALDVITTGNYAVAADVGERNLG